MDKNSDNLYKKDEMGSKNKYGEVIPSMFSWMTIDYQKKRAEELDKMTRKDKKK